MSWRIFARSYPGTLQDFRPFQLRLCIDSSERFSFLQPRVLSDRHQWAVSARNVWMDSEAFASFVLHDQNPLGCLAAQLLGASTVRYGSEAVNMIRPGQTGAKTWHFDVQSNLRLEQSPRGLPLLRFFLPLGPQDLSANSTGGSLQLLSIEAVRHLRRSYKSCFVDRERRLVIGAECAVAAEAMSETPDLSLGDMVLYSPLVAHKTQTIYQGERTGYLGSLYDPELLTRWVRQEPVPSQADPERYRLPGSMLFDVFCMAGAACYDQSSGECHHNLNWQSAATQGISDGTTPCFPQIYPSRVPSEVATRLAKQLTNPYGPDMVLSRWVLHTMPCFKMLLAPVYLALDAWYSRR